MPCDRCPAPTIFSHLDQLTSERFPSSEGGRKAARCFNEFGFVHLSHARIRSGIGLGQSSSATAPLISLNIGCRGQRRRSSTANCRSLLMAEQLSSTAPIGS